MARVVPSEYKRDKIAKTGIRPCEDELLKGIADDLGVVKSEVVYIALIKYLISMRPKECTANNIRFPVLVTE